MCAGASGFEICLYGRGPAIVVLDSNFDFTVVSSSRSGVYLSVERPEGKMLLASFYYRFSSPLEPYLRFMDSASRCPQILELYSNAPYSLWFSEMSRHSYDHQKRIREKMLVEWELWEGFDILTIWWALGSWFFASPRIKREFNPPRCDTLRSHAFLWAVESHTMRYARRASG